MNDERIKHFDQLGDLVLELRTYPTGSDFGKIADSGLTILKRIVNILKVSPEYEHGLQKVADVEVILKSAKDDFYLSGNDLNQLEKNYSQFRFNSLAGKHVNIF
jgi:hypothetical protein